MNINFDYNYYHKKNLIFLALILALFTIIGFLIGYFSGASGSDQTNNSNKYLDLLTKDADDKYFLELVKENINVDNIQKHLK
jgi:hypothetical protein